MIHAYKPITQEESRDLVSKDQGGGSWLKKRLGPVVKSMYYSYRIQFLSLTALCSCGFRGSDTRVHMAFTHSHTNFKYKGQRERQRKAKCSHAQMLDYQLERSQP